MQSMVDLLRITAALALTTAIACNSAATVFEAHPAPPPTAGCGLPAAAFCETFETPSPGGRGGDLDEAAWSFARWGHQVQYLWERAPARTYDDGHLFPATFCGAPFAGVLPDLDVRACPGPGVDGTVSRQLNEVFDDQGDYGVNSMRVRQPFDFAGRTGTIVWDVDAKVNPLNSGHGWWFEVWLTDDPAPMPHHQAPGVLSLPHRGIGFSFISGADCPEDPAAWQNGLETVYVTDNYQLVRTLPFYELEAVPQRCFKAADGRLNHFELRISEDRAEIWASDHDDPGSLALRAFVPALALTFSRGFVHLQHGGFNAALDGNVTPSQTFRWDNVGFDGPALRLPRSYDVPDNGQPGQNGGVMFGWFLDGAPRTFLFRGVDPTGAHAASLSFTLDGLAGVSLAYQVNGGPTHSFIYPDSGAPTNGGVRGLSAEVPVAELRSGDNSVTVSLPAPAFAREGIGNVDLTVDVD